MEMKISRFSIVCFHQKKFQRLADLWKENTYSRALEGGINLDSGEHVSVEDLNEDFMLGDWKVIWWLWQNDPTTGAERYFINSG